MMNWSVIYGAAELASMWLEAKGITMSTDSLVERIAVWYNHTDICDVISLANLGIWGDYKVLSWNELEKAMKGAY